MNDKKVKGSKSDETRTKKTWKHKHGQPKGGLASKKSRLKTPQTTKQPKS